MIKPRENVGKKNSHLLYIFYFGLLVSILILCSFTTYKVLKHKEIYTNDPLVYGAISRNISYCECIKDNGNFLHFNKKNLKIIVQGNTNKEHYDVNISNLNISFIE